MQVFPAPSLDLSIMSQGSPHDLTVQSLRMVLLLLSRHEEGRETKSTSSDFRSASYHVLSTQQPTWAFKSTSPVPPSLTCAVAWLSLRTGPHFLAQPPRPACPLLQPHHSPLSARVPAILTHKPPNCFSKVGKSLLPQSLDFPEHFPLVSFSWLCSFSSSKVSSAVTSSGRSSQATGPKAAPAPFTPS